MARLWRWWDQVPRDTQFALVFLLLLALGFGALCASEAFAQ